MENIPLWPPIIMEVEKVFDLSGKKPVFAYGKILFNPMNLEIDMHLLAHELTHCAQQENRPDIWWKKYLVDKEFRLSQESEAYHAQYQSVSRVAKDRNALARYVSQLAFDFSGKMYGSMVTYQDAIKIIRYGHC